MDPHHRHSTKHHTPSGDRSYPMPGSFPDVSLYPRTPSPEDRRSTAIRSLTQTQSPSRRGNHDTPVISMPEPYRPQRPTWVSSHQEFGAPSGHSHSHIAQRASASQPTEQWQMPEPQITRSISHKTFLHPPPISSRPRAHSSTDQRSTFDTSMPNPTFLGHKHSFSEGQGANGRGFGEEVLDGFDTSPSVTPSILSEDFSQISLSEFAANGLASVNALERFQNGEGDDNDWAWHLLVTKEARESLPMPEVMRQSAIFDLINGERSYVNDLELVQEVYVDGLRNGPPVLPQERLDGFVQEVFWNMDRILTHHWRMLGSLFELQREQHPILLSVGDLVLDTVLKFQSEYESYIKHYPLAESLHRRELKINAQYRAFIEKCSHDPRLGKRDVVTFISRPVTRLPRLSLQLMEIKKRTEKLSKAEGDDEEGSNKEDYPDLETIPIVVDILSRFVKSTQPGIEASESKAKFYALCESLKFRKGEIIDMDLYDESRTLVHSGTLARKQRSDNWSGWTDLEVGLLDNYVLITKPDTRTGRNEVVSRPIPLEYLCLGPFRGPPENRREERSERGGLLDTLIKPTRPVFPLVIYHASAPARRYTLYANSESARNKWKEAFVNALGVKSVIRDANKWFALDHIEDGYFRIRTLLVPEAYQGLFTGKICSAVSFTSGGKNIIAIGTPTGLYVGVRGQSRYGKVLPMGYVSFMSALQGFNKLIILHNGVLLAYSLDVIARVGQGLAPHHTLDATLERLTKSGGDGPVSFFRVGSMAGKTLVVYGCKSFLTFTLHVLEAMTEQVALTLQRTRSQPYSQTKSPTISLSFRPYGEAFYVPKEPFDVTFLVKTVAISTDRLMTVVDPTNLTGQTPVPIPDFSGVNGHSNPADSVTAALKAKCEAARPIGIVRSGREELMVVYDEFGCYVTKHAVPTRKSGYVRWETKAIAYTQRGAYLLLFSAGFLEIRHVSTGRLVQVIEGQDIRLLQSQPNSPLLIAIRGKKDDKEGTSDALIELVETAAIEAPQPTPVTSRPENPNPFWGEWD